MMLLSASKNICYIFQLLQLATVISNLQFHLFLARRERKGRQPCYPSMWTQTANQENMSSRVYLSTSPLKLSARFASLWQSLWWVYATTPFKIHLYTKYSRFYSSKKRWIAFPLISQGGFDTIGKFLKSYNEVSWFKKRKWESRTSKQSLANTFK